MVNDNDYSLSDTQEYTKIDYDNVHAESPLAIQ